MKLLIEELENGLTASVIELIALGRGADVLKAISQLEGRPRDYFMGNIVLYFPEQSVLKSSVLIRTIVGNPLKNHYQYAAGGGVVVRSNAHDELLEIQQKCRVLTGKLLP